MFNFTDATALVLSELLQVTRKRILALREEARLLRLAARFFSDISNPSYLPTYGCAYPATLRPPGRTASHSADQENSARPHIFESLIHVEYLLGLTIESLLREEERLHVDFAKYLVDQHGVMHAIPRRPGLDSDLKRAAWLVVDYFIPLCHLSRLLGEALATFATLESFFTQKAECLGPYTFSVPRIFKRESVKTFLHEEETYRQYKVIAEKLTPLWGVDGSAGQTRRRNRLAPARRSKHPLLCHMGGAVSSLAGSFRKPSRLR